MIHPDLRKLEKHWYGTELRSRTLASIKPEICQALTFLLDKIRTADDVKIMRAAVGNYRKPTGNRTPYKTNTRPNRPTKSCPLCKQGGRHDNAHFLSECSFLPEQDRNYTAKAREIADIFDDPSEPETRSCVDESMTDTDDTGSSPTSHVFRIHTRQSTYLDMFYAHHPVRVTIDSSTTGNMIRHTVVQCLHCQVTPSSQSVHQADGSSPLHVVSETRFHFTHKGHTFTFEGFVVENLDVDFLAGTPLMESNNIAVRSGKHQVILGDGTIHNYGSQQLATINSTARRAIVVRSPPTSTTIWPGEFLELGLPSNAPHDSVYTVEPRTEAPSVRKLTAPNCGHSQPWSPVVREKYASPLNSRTTLPQTEQTLLLGSCCLHTGSSQHQHTAASLATTQATSTFAKHKTLCQCDPRPKQLTISGCQS